MGFALFIGSLFALALFNTTKESREEARKKWRKYDYLVWLWPVNIAIFLSFFLF